MRSILYFITFFVGSLAAEEVVVVGGRPAGLATALEARLCGYEVKVLEKRATYTRDQWVFLYTESLGLLAKWKVEIPEMFVAEVFPGLTVGVTRLKFLERGFEKRAKELGVQKIQAEFKKIKERAITIDSPGQEIRYDILVGADGVHSAVRKELGIELNVFGKATGAYVEIPLPEQDYEIKFLAEQRQGELFIRKISMPKMRIVSAQIQQAQLQIEEKMARNCGWELEADLIAKKKAQFFNDIPILLQQAEKFFDAKQGAILVGDAAAVASFFQGESLNTALKSASIAGEFFQRIKNNPAEAYTLYDQSMKQATDALAKALRNDPTSSYGEVANVLSAQGPQRDAYTRALLSALSRNSSYAAQGQALGNTAALAAALAGEQYLDDRLQPR